MFEQRTICLWAYSLENVLAEKIETILVRATFNTRLRDFYDIHILQNIGRQVDTTILFTALTATCHRRNSEYVLPDYNHILTRIEKNQTMCVSCGKISGRKIVMRQVLHGKRSCSRSVLSVKPAWGKIIFICPLEKCLIKMSNYEIYILFPCFLS